MAETNQDSDQLIVITGLPDEVKMRADPPKSGGDVMQALSRFGDGNIKDEKGILILGPDPCPAGVYTFIPATSVQGSLASRSVAGSERSGGLTPEQAHQLSELFRLMPRLPNQESYTMSNMNSGKWAKVRDSQDLSFRLCDKLRPARQEKRDIPLFGWTEENESAQASRYGPHMQRIISTGREVLWKDVSNNRQFLDVTLHAGDSKFHLKGTSDYVAVTKASVRARVINAGLLMLFELKKDIQNDDIFQSMAQLLAANIHSPDLKPTVVCTDLRDEWQLFWLDGNTIFQHTAQSRSAAVALLEDILDGAAKSATTEGLEREEETSSRSPGVADAFSVERVLKRQKFATADAHGGSLAQIADLQGFLPDEEYKDALLRSALQDLLNIPSLASLHEPRSPPMGMYI